MPTAQEDVERLQQFCGGYNVRHGQWTLALKLNIILDTQIYSHWLLTDSW